MRHGRRKPENLSNTRGRALQPRALWGTRPAGLQGCYQSHVPTTVSLPLSILFWLLSFLPSFSFFYLRWSYESFGILSPLNTLDFRMIFEKRRKKSAIQYIAIHHYLPVTALPAIFARMRALLFQLIWIHASNASSRAPMLKLRSITSSALPLSANVIIWFLSNWVSFDVISYLETQAYLQVFCLYACVYNLYRYFLLGCPLIVLERLGISHFYLFYK